MPDPTRLDSLNLLKNTRELEDYYRNSNKYTYRPEHSQHPSLLADPLGLLKDKRDAFDARYEKGDPTALVQKSGPAKNFLLDPSYYYKDLPGDNFQQRELANSVLNINAPMARYNTKIAPTEHRNYLSKNTRTSTADDNVDIFGYDPLAVTPADMLSDTEIIKRVNKHGPSGIPISKLKALGLPLPKAKAVPEVSEAAKKRKENRDLLNQQLKEAGLYNRAKGITGRNPEASRMYEEYMRSKQPSQSSVPQVPNQVQSAGEAIKQPIEERIPEGYQLNLGYRGADGRYYGNTYNPTTSEGETYPVPGAPTLEDYKRIRAAEINPKRTGTRFVRADFAYGGRPTDPPYTPTYADSLYLYDRSHGDLYFGEGKSYRDAGLKNMSPAEYERLYKKQPKAGETGGGQMMVNWSVLASDRVPRKTAPIVDYYNPAPEVDESFANDPDTRSAVNNKWNKDFLETVKNAPIAPTSYSVQGFQYRPQKIEWAETYKPGQKAEEWTGEVSDMKSSYGAWYPKNYISRANYPKPKGTPEYGSDEYNALIKSTFNKPTTKERSPSSLKREEARNILKKEMDTLGFTGYTPRQVLKKGSEAEKAYQKHIENYTKTTAVETPKVVETPNKATTHKDKIKNYRTDLEDYNKEAKAFEEYDKGYNQREDDWKNNYNSYKEKLNKDWGEARNVPDWKIGLNNADGRGVDYLINQGFDIDDITWNDLHWVQQNIIKEGEGFNSSRSFIKPVLNKFTEEYTGVNPTKPTKPKVTLPEGYSYKQDDTRDADMNDYFFTNKNGSKKRISREEFIEATGYAPRQFRERHVEVPEFRDGGPINNDGPLAKPQGDIYLPLDGTRPSYTDASGKERSEYKIGIGTKEGEMVIPTVWNGEQHTEDEAIDRYYNTGEHMGGPYGSIEEGERAAKLRTFLYNEHPAYSKKAYGGPVKTQDVTTNEYGNLEGFKDVQKQNIFGRDIHKRIEYDNYGGVGGSKTVTKEKGPKGRSNKSTYEVETTGPSQYNRKSGYSKTTPSGKQIQVSKEQGEGSRLVDKRSYDPATEILDIKTRGYIGSNPFAVYKRDLTQEYAYGGCAPKYAQGGQLYEAEGGEVIDGGNPITLQGGYISPNSSNSGKIVGNSHGNGGVKMTGGEKIYSDRLTVDASFLKDLDI